MEILTVKKLSKHYPGFDLKDVSFSLRAGRITGFIGRNGAGKTTTLKSLFRFIHPDTGEVRFWGMDIRESERAVKQRVGFLSGGVDYYPKKKLRRITAVTRMFYDNWDEDGYRKRMREFSLDEEKTPSELSAGMKVKYALALALSHGAELLILDEPTSGLDPVSREDLLEELLGLAEEGKTIFFSTHITSDLDRCADDILYIRAGRICAESDIAAFTGAYRLAAYSLDAPPDESERRLLIGERRAKNGTTALVRTEDAGKLTVNSRNADLEEIMIHLEKEERAEN